MNLFLIGYRCTGKTTIGKAVATKLGMNFVDVDQVFSAETGSEIATFVDKRGWEAFRAKERDMINRLSQLNGQVVATGGGTVIVPDNVTVMRSSGSVVWLQASADTVRKRMIADLSTRNSRPSLTGQGALEEIAQVFMEREPLYKAAAHYCIPTDELSIDEITEAIIKMILNH